MNIQCQEIDIITNEFQKSFGHLNAGQLNWKPNAGTWSIGQIIDHLIVINRTYFPIIDLCKKNEYFLPFLAKIPFVVSFFGKTVLKAVHPDRRKKMKTLPIWEPAGSHIREDILQIFANHQEDLKNMILSCSELIQKGSVISSPANKFIVYKLETAFDIIITHEKRHFEQAKEVLQTMQHSLA